MSGYPVRPASFDPGHSDQLDITVTGGLWDLETVAASQTDQVIGNANARIGDYLHSVIVVPATTSPGVVSMKDGGGSAVTLFTGGASSVADLRPFVIPIESYSTSGAWQLTTGANVSVIARFRQQ